jgi:hypothetical protein
MIKKAYIFYVIIIQFLLVQYSLSQTVFLDDMDGFYAYYSRYNNKISNGWVIYGAYSIRAKYDIGFAFTNYDAEEIDDSFLAYFALNVRDRNVPIRSLGTISIGVTSVEGEVGYLLGLGFSALFPIDQEYSLAPDIGGGFSTFKFGESTNTYYHLEPSLGMGLSLSYETKLGFFFIRPGLSFSREVRSYLLSAGFVIKNDYKIKAGVDEKK